jgi:hypothetical protein
VRERATRASWKIQPPPARTANIPVDLACTPEEFERLRYGLVPQDMDDRWLVYAESRTVHFHRSWTGYWIASVPFTEGGDRFRATCAPP